MKNIMIETRQNPLTFFQGSGLVSIPHVHKELEIVYVKKGRAVCFADNKFYEISDDDLFITFPNQVHYYMNSELGEYHVLIFPVDILYNLKNIFFNNIPVSNMFHVGRESHISVLVNNIITQDGELKDTIQVGMVNQLIPLCLSKLTLKARMYTKSSNLQKILDYCSQNFAEDISLETIAKELHYSRHHISYLINQKLNMSFKSYINTLRINEAINLMKDKSRNMAYISEEVGFGSIRSFDRAFMKIMNTTPSSYYKQFVKKIK